LMTVWSTSCDESGSHSMPLLSSCRQQVKIIHIFSKGTVELHEYGRTTTKQLSKQTFRIRYRKRDFTHPAQSCSSSEVEAHRAMRRKYLYVGTYGKGSKRHVHSKSCLHKSCTRYKRTVESW
jgi:hypothetical protein